MTNFSLARQLESVMKKNQQQAAAPFEGGPTPRDQLQSLIKMQSCDMLDEDEEDAEPRSVLDLTQCISPPLQPGAWAAQQQAAALAELEQQQAQSRWEQHQVFLWQQNQLWEQQQLCIWEQQQAELAELQYLQNAERLKDCATGSWGGPLPAAAVADAGGLQGLRSSWDSNPDSLQSSGVVDPMLSNSQSDPWVDFHKEQDLAFGEQLLQGLPPLDDPLILDNSWMTSSSSDSSISSLEVDVKSSSSPSFDSNEQKQEVKRGSWFTGVNSVATKELPELMNMPVDHQYDIHAAIANNTFNGVPDLGDVQSPTEDLKFSSSWFGQDPCLQKLQPTPPVANFVTCQQSQTLMGRNQTPVAQFQMPIEARYSKAEPTTHNHETSNKRTFSNESKPQQAVAASSTIDVKPSFEMQKPIPLAFHRRRTVAPAAAEPVSKPSTKLWGPVRPASHSIGVRDSIYARPSEPKRRAIADTTANQKSNGHHPGLLDLPSRNSVTNLESNVGANHNASNARNNSSGMGGAGRVVTLAELASGGVKMGGVQLPTVGTQIPSVVRLAVETQASGSGGVRMVQLLLACAEAVACRDARQANIHLQQLQHMASPHGDAMQRITACFVEGLHSRLAMNGSQPFKFSSPPVKPPSEAEKLEGFNLVYQSSPYVAFGHFAANTSILEAFEGEEKLHIVDLGMTHALQWPYLIESLAKRASGPPKLLRITGFGLSTERMQEAGEELSRVASAANVPFEFRAVTESLEGLEKSMLQLREGEALAVNSVLQLHCVVKESRGSLNAVLQSINDLSPKILTLVEQDASHNGPFFLGRFMESLHYYSAIFDSLDAILPRGSPQRVKMEQFHFAEEIKNIVSCEGPARVERHERVDQWRRRMSRASFQPLPLKFLAQAKVWLGLYSCQGYTLSEEKGCLVLGWKGKPIIAASSWKR